MSRKKLFLWNDAVYESEKEAQDIIQKYEDD